MELRTFVKTALIDIINGLKDAQNECVDAVIVPKQHTGLAYVSAKISPLQVIEFEVSVIAEESKGTEGKLGVVNSLINAGVAGKSEKGTTSASILKFSVPVFLPTGGDEPNQR